MTGKLKKAVGPEVVVVVIPRHAAWSIMIWRALLPSWLPSPILVVEVGRYQKPGWSADHEVGPWAAVLHKKAGTILVP